MLLPPSLEELVPKSHPARIVNEVINKINLGPLNAAYFMLRGKQKVEIEWGLLPIAQNIRKKAA